MGIVCELRSNPLPAGLTRIKGDKALGGQFEEIKIKTFPAASKDRILEWQRRWGRSEGIIELYGAAMELNEAGSITVATGVIVGN